MSPETATIDQMRIPRTREEWKDVLTEDLHVPGERVEKLAAERNGLIRRKDLLQAVQDANPEMNGQAKVVAETLATNIEQIDAERAFLRGEDREPDDGDEQGVQTEVAESIKRATESKDKGNAIVRSAKWIYEKTFKEHPILTSAAFAVLLYYTGGGAAMLTRAMEWVAKIPDGALKRYVMQIPRLGGAGAASGVNQAIGIPSDLPV